MRITKTKMMITLASMATLICALYTQPVFADGEGSGSKSDHKGMAGDHKGGEHGKYEGKEGYGHGEGHGGGHGHHFISHVIKYKDKLALSADQVSGLEKVQADYKKQYTDIHAEEGAAYKELHALAHADNIDEAGMHSAADKMSAAKSKEIHAMVSTKIAAMKILTPEQRKKMKELHDEMKKEHAPAKK
jgi:Spy/CpxP family protein refolding chaperone